MPRVHTQTAHIFDESTASTDVSDSGVGPKARYLFLIQNTYPPTILVLYRYARPLWCCNRHYVRNVITLEGSVRTSSDELELWLEPTVRMPFGPSTSRKLREEPHRHTPFGRPGLIPSHYMTRKEFTTSDREKPPLPSPYIFNSNSRHMHKVAHLSGAVEHIARCRE
ncbi:hypothetical protein BJV78DRAFT_218810 [Lactifluus subvellereus]|nr:hypothetical protein BJV78DRAFT_218810 [Lactifluus subvellereus]